LVSSVNMRLPASGELMLHEVRRPVRGKFRGSYCPVCSANPFDIASLESETLTRLFKETTSYMQNIRIEEVARGRRDQGKEKHPATTIGLTVGTPTVQFAGWLDKGQRIEAIAHELAHLVLVYRFGLGVIGRRVPRPGDSEDAFEFFMSMRGDWVYLLGQIANTAHHLILTDYLKQEYEIEGNLHVSLLHQNFCIAANDHVRDQESQYANGIVAFEYEKLIGKVETTLNISQQGESFRTAYHFAQKHFGGYGFRSIPAASAYQEDILSFLEGLGYPRADFLFFP
jgi:hypothetical protein